MSSDPTRELADFEARMRGDPLTPEDEARLRARERRLAQESRIRMEEWDKVQGFPYWPPWIMPALVTLIVICGVLGAASFIAHIIGH